MNVIGGFLGNDSMLGKILTKCGTIIIINLLFVLSCVPFFTIGAAQTAMYHAIFAMLNAEDEINPWKEYWKGFRKNFVRASLYWLAFAGILALGYIDLQVCAQWNGEISFVVAGIMAVMFATIVIMLYLFPILSMFSGKPSELLQKAIYFAMNRPLRLVMVLLLHIVPVFVLYADEVNRPTYAFVGMFFGFGLIAYVTGKMLLSQFKRYAE